MIAAPRSSVAAQAGGRSCMWEREREGDRDQMRGGQLAYEQQPQVRLVLDQQTARYGGVVEAWADGEASAFALRRCSRCSRLCSWPG